MTESLDLSRAERVYAQWPLWKQQMANQILRPTPERREGTMERSGDVVGNTEYMIVSDDDGHDFVIPADKMAEWDQYMADPEMPYIDQPEWAKPVGGSLRSVVFTGYRFV